MLTLTQTATLHRRAGRRDGAPAYEPEGEALRCRVQPGVLRTSGSMGLGLSREAMVFADPVKIAPGDRLVLEDGSAMVVGKVTEIRGFAGAHHLEIEVSEQA